MLTVQTTYRSGSLDLDYRASRSDLRVCELGPPSVAIHGPRLAINLSRIPRECSFVSVIARCPAKAGDVAQCAESLCLRICSGQTEVLEISDVTLDAHVDWFCLGVFVKVASKWAFKEVLSFPDERGNVDRQLGDLLQSIQQEIVDPPNSLDDSYTFFEFSAPVQTAPPAPLPVELPVARAPRLIIPVPGSLAVVRRAEKPGSSLQSSSFVSPRSPNSPTAQFVHPRALGMRGVIHPAGHELSPPVWAGQPVPSSGIAGAQTAPRVAAAQGTPESGVGIATESQLGQLDFFVHHNREVRSLQTHVERLEGELAKYRSRDVGEPRKLVAHLEGRSGRPPVCEDCAKKEAQVAEYKERLVELEATAVLNELMGGSQNAELCIVQEDNRTLRLRCAEMEGKCAIQEKLIAELRLIKKQLVSSITKIPKQEGTGTATAAGASSSRTGERELMSADVCPDQEDPVIHHIRVQERLIAALKEQLEILGTQLTIGQALGNQHNHAYDELQ